MQQKFGSLQFGNTFFVATRSLLEINNNFNVFILFHPQPIATWNQMFTHMKETKRSLLSVVERRLWISFSSNMFGVCESIADALICWFDCTSTHKSTNKQTDPKTLTHTRILHPKNNKNPHQIIYIIWITNTRKQSNTKRYKYLHKLRHHFEHWNWAHIGEFGSLRTNKRASATLSSSSSSTSTMANTAVAKTTARNKTKQKNFVEPIRAGFASGIQIVFRCASVSFDCRYIEFTFDIKYFCAYQFHSRRILVHCTVWVAAAIPAGWAFQSEIPVNKFICCFRLCSPDSHKILATM